MKLTIDSLRPGCRVMLRGNFGGGPLEIATVTGVYRDIKNGRPGIEYKTATTSDHWAYLAQVEQIVTEG